MLAELGLMSATKVCKVGYALNSNNKCVKVPIMVPQSSPAIQQFDSLSDFPVRKLIVGASILVGGAVVFYLLTRK